MKILAVIRKSLSEQARQIWIVLLTISMAPFFVGIYFLMWESTKPSLDIELVNLDEGFEGIDYGNIVTQMIMDKSPDSMPIKFHLSEHRSKALEQIRNKKSEAILLLPEDFSEALTMLTRGEETQVPFEISGDLSDINYMLAATFTYELIVSYITENTGVVPIYEFRETPVGISGELDEFDLYVPGLIILSIVMLMFTAAIAFVREPEQRTMVRLKLSHIKNWEFISGVSLVQIAVGFISVFLTLAMASALGFEFHGSWGSFLLVTTLTCLSIIGFSLIVAAITRTVNQVLVVGNFPLFLFMFFTGAMMPIHGPTLFSFASYDFTLPGLMSPYHAVNALKKISIYQASLVDVWPELSCLVGITIIYFLVGGWLYRRQHLRLL